MAVDVRSRQNAKLVCINCRHEAMSAGEVLEVELCFPEGRRISLCGHGRGKNEEEESDLSLRQRGLRLMRG